MAIIKGETEAAPVARGKNLREELADIFTAFDVVAVKNILPFDINHPYLPSTNEKALTRAGANNTKFVTGRAYMDGDQYVAGKRNTISIKAGAEDVIPGEAAFIIIPFIINTKLQLEESATTKKNGNLTQEEIKLRTITSSKRRRELLDEVYLGLAQDRKSTNRE